MALGHPGLVASLGLPSRGAAFRAHRADSQAGCGSWPDNKCYYPALSANDVAEQLTALYLIASLIFWSGRIYPTRTSTRHSEKVGARPRSAKRAVFTAFTVFPLRLVLAQ